MFQFEIVWTPNIKLLLLRNQIHFLQNRAVKIFNFLCFEKSSKYVGVTIHDTTSKRPWLAWQPELCIDCKHQYLGYFKTEIKAAKFVNFVCKKTWYGIKQMLVHPWKPPPIFIDLISFQTWCITMSVQFTGFFAFCFPFFGISILFLVAFCLVLNF